MSKTFTSTDQAQPPAPEAAGEQRNPFDGGDGQPLAILTGIAASGPVLAHGLDGNAEALLRFAVPRDRQGADWYVAAASGQLAYAVCAPVSKGDRLLIAGIPTTAKEGTQGLTVTHCGHDVHRGHTCPTRQPGATR